MLELMVTGETAMNVGSEQGGHFKGIKGLFNLEAQHLAVVEDIPVSHGRFRCIHILPENEPHLKPNKFQQRRFQGDGHCGVGIAKSSGCSLVTI